MRRRLFAAAVALALGTGAAPDPLTKPIEPKYADRWLGPQAPTKLYGDTYYVGFGGLSLALIDTGAGLILIDGAVPQAVGDVEAHVRQLGFRVTDIKYILNTESHWDHASGIAALARDSGATAVASAWGADVLRRGRPPADDPQHDDLLPFPAVARVRTVGDGETIRLGHTVVTAHMTPGHTPGSTSWSWRSCEAGKCLNVVFASSLNPISSEGYYFTGSRSRTDNTRSFRRTFQTVRALPCDILISAHPENSGLDAKLKRAGAKPNPFVDPAACRTYAAKYEALFDKRIAEERRGR